MTNDWVRHHPSENLSIWTAFATWYQHGLTAESQISPFSFHDNKSRLCMWDTGDRYSSSGGEAISKLYSFMIIHILFLEMKGSVFCLLYTWYKGLVLSIHLNILSKQVFFFPFLSLLYFKKKNVRYLTWYLFDSLLFFAPSLFFFFILNWFVNFFLQLNESAEMGCWWISLDSSQHCSEIKSQYALMGHSIIGKALLPGSNHNHLATPYIWKEHD